VLRLHPQAFAWLAQSFTRRTNCFTVFYSLSLTLAGLALLPRAFGRAPRAWRPLEEIGKASYHIFLVQMVWFGVVSGRTVAAGIAGIAASMLLGYGFFRLPMPSLGLGAGRRAQGRAEDHPAKPRREPFCGRRSMTRSTSP
jgi:peptidoglycan/LPS O-acetylase OafA/YrhL